MEQLEWDCSQKQILEHKLHERDVKWSDKDEMLISLSQLSGHLIKISMKFVILIPCTSFKLKQVFALARTFF